jgi:hypothetical protein
MTVITVGQARARLDATCRRALKGQLIRLRLKSGEMVELTPVIQPPMVRALSAAELADCYGDAAANAFENHCGRVSN